MRLCPAPNDGPDERSTAVAQKKSPANQIGNENLFLSIAKFYTYPIGATDITRPPNSGILRYVSKSRKLGRRGLASPARGDRQGAK
jgi:hypothetical protein